MERCKLTQRPCREAISEVVQANTNRKSLQLTYDVAKLLQIAPSKENSILSEKDFKRYFLIIKLFMIEDLRRLECIDAFTNGLMVRQR